jgi:DNA-binding transcriptional LysR family regulator
MATTSFSLVQLEYFCAVAECGSFVGAAAAASITPNAVAAAVSSLERSLGAVLCVRHRSKGVDLTRHGKLLYAEAQSLLRAARQVAESVATPPEETARPAHIGYHPGGGDIAAELVVVLNNILGQAPISLHQVDREDLATALLGGELDLAIVDEDPRSPGLSAHPLLETQVCAAVGIDHPLARSTSVDWDGLRAHRLVRVEPPEGNPVIDPIFDSHDLDAAVRWRTADPDVVNAIVANGLGISLVERCSRSHLLDDPRVVELALPRSAAGRTLHLAWSARHHLSATMCGAITAAISGLRTVPAPRPLSRLAG